MAKDSMVKVVANYSFSKDPKITLWGVDFELIEGQYVASIPKEDADKMVEAGRATILG